MVLPVRIQIRFNGSSSVPFISSFLLRQRLRTAEGSEGVQAELASCSLPNLQLRRPALPRCRPERVLTGGVGSRPPAGGYIYRLNTCADTHTQRQQGNAVTEMHRYTHTHKGYVGRRTHTLQTHTQRKG